MRPAAVGHDDFHAGVPGGDVLHDDRVGIGQVGAEGRADAHDEDAAELGALVIDGREDRIVALQRRVQPARIDADALEAHLGDAALHFFDSAFLAGVDPGEGEEAARILLGQLIQFVVVHDAEIVGMAAHEHGLDDAVVVHFLDEGVHVMGVGGDVGLAPKLESSPFGGIFGQRTPRLVQAQLEETLVGGTGTEIDDHGGFLCLRGPHISWPKTRG